MSRHFLLIITLCSALLCGCGKTIAEEVENEKENTETPSNGKDNEEENDNENEGSNDPEEGGENGEGGNGEGNNVEYLTVTQALALENDSAIYVVGYVVGTCSRSINNRDMEAPFENTAAILLCDTLLNGESVPANISDVLLPVNISDIGGMRKELNLRDNEHLFCKKIIVAGYSQYYLGKRGLRRVFDYRVLD